MAEIPYPVLKPGYVRVRNFVSLVSVGTEKYMLEMAKKSLLGKAIARPDLVRQVIAKAQAEGIQEAWRQARGRLDTPVPLGYSCAGLIIDVGKDVEGFTVGERVACAGSGYASHAEVVSIPKNLCVKIPENVYFESAAFVALGGIALQAVRDARVSLGERVAIIGLGLLGQITAQLLKATGCHVFGIDISQEKLDLALTNGCKKAVSSKGKNVIKATAEFAPMGFDSVIIMATAKSNEPLELAAEICREKGRIVASGLVGLNIPRKAFFEKELDFTVSRAWGPGIFDPMYIEKNIDYPYAYARWTAKRNMEEFLQQVSTGAVDVKKLITHRFSIGKALDAYEMILRGTEKYMGVLISYPEGKNVEHKTDICFSLKKGKAEVSKKEGDFVRAGCIGAGLYATGTLFPVLKSLKQIHLKGVAALTGIEGHHASRKFGFEYLTTDYKKIIDDEELDLVFVLTKHGTHARFVTEALQAGKNVFVEKPLCISEFQLKEIISAYERRDGHIVMVGFNRRFSPFTRWLKDKFSNGFEPSSVHCTVNAGPLPQNHWVYDPEEGGGRIIGEVCHFVDLMQYLTGSVPVRVHAETIESRAGKPDDNVHIHIKMTNGSVGSIQYLSGGDKRYQRERVEVFGGGAVGVIENFKKASFTCGGRRKNKQNKLSVDRGHRKEIEALIQSILHNRSTPVNFEEYVYTTLATFAIEKSLRTGNPVEIKIKSL